MGMFTALGRKAERVKQAVTSDGTYRCLSCEESLSEDVENCPHCGSERVVSAE
jgi:rRNA maturation endonuclease Nob1